MWKTGFNIKTKKAKYCFGTYTADFDDEGFYRDSNRLIEPHQKINQFPETEAIWYSKARMWQDLKYQMVRFGKDEFNFVPDTYIWPEEKEELKEQFPTSSLWITKPELVSIFVSIILFIF